MSWIRSSKSVALVVLITLSLAVAGQAVALSVSVDGAPDQSQVGDPVNATVTIEDPFDGPPDTWTLRGSTDLRNVSWRVTVLQQGDPIEGGDTTYSDQTFEQPLNLSNGGDTVRIVIEGDAPPVSQFNYESNETFTLYDVERVAGDSTIDIDDSSVYHYTNESRVAREEIMRAERTINETGGTDQAKRDLQNAKSFYNSERFDEAISLARDAQQQARSSQQSSQLLLYGGVGVLVLLLVAGGVYYWRSQQDDYGKLQ